MSLGRLNTLLMRGVVPFNFGMTYEGWVKLYADHPQWREHLCPTDPATWREEKRERINRKAREETELVSRLMKLPDAEFDAELDRLVAEQEREDAGA